MRPVPTSVVRRFFAPFLSLALFAGAARATWSIVVVDKATGEVCVASATCLANFDLQRWLPVVRVGVGAAAAQSSVDTSGQNRNLIWARMQAGFNPRMILQGLEQADSQHQTRQYGIVTLAHTPLTFTGTNVGLARYGVQGHKGSVHYAIQGNVITGIEVVLAAEHVLRNAEGDLGQRVMAAMMAARNLGGDGRCSCAPSTPTICGTPPADFEKAAHVAFIVLARVGDVDGVCNTTVGCASGDYYLDLQRTGPASDPDPVIELRAMHQAWRETWFGRPDHLLSEIDVPVDALVADGVSDAVVTVRLVDVDGNPLASGGAQLQVAWTGGGAPVASVGPIADHGDGTYSFALQAGATPGLGSWSVTADDGQGAVRLYPDLRLRVDPLAELHAGVDAVELSEGADVPFALNLGGASAGASYLLLGSLSGTRPGQPFHGIHLALNHDDFFVLTLEQPGPPHFPGSIGVLDAAGRAEAGFVASPAELLAFGGSRFDWVAVIGGGAVHATNGVGFDLVP